MAENRKNGKLIVLLKLSSFGRVWERDELFPVPAASFHPNFTIRAIWNCCRQILP
jgi:hypothetical protein